MTCAHFGRDQICTQVKASFLPFGPPTQVNVSWVTSVSLLLVNEIQEMSSLKCGFLGLVCTCEETCQCVWPPRASLYASLTCRYLRHTCESVWPGLKNRSPSNINRKTHRKVTKIKSKFSFILGLFDPASPGAQLLGLAKSIYAVNSLTSDHLAEGPPWHLPLVSDHFVPESYEFVEGMKSREGPGDEVATDVLDFLLV